MVTCTIHYKDHDVINTYNSTDSRSLYNQVKKLLPVTSKVIYHDNAVGTAHVVLKPFNEPKAYHLFREMI